MNKPASNSSLKCGASRKSSRREFIKKTSVGLAAAAAYEVTAPGAFPSGKLKDRIPPHRALDLTGLHAYADQISLAAGQTIGFHVSSTVPYQLSICRLGLEVDNPAGDKVLHEFPTAPVRSQPIHPGSYVYVEKRLNRSLDALTLECWVRPWKIEGWAGLISQFEFQGGCGLGLFLNPKSGVSFYLGNGEQMREEWMHSGPDKQIQPGGWHHIVATWNGKEKQIWLDGTVVGNWPFDGKVEPGRALLRLGACAEQSLQANHFLDGDMAMTVIYDHALTGAEIEKRFAQQGLTEPAGRGVLACWPFVEERGDRVADTSRQERHGRIINHATWMIGGPSFKSEVAHYGDYDPARDDRRGHGLRLAADDLYDCRWTPTHHYRVPANAKPGIYVGRIRYEQNGQPLLYHITFIVRKTSRAKKAPILVLCATNTWRAYNAAAFAVNRPGLKQVCGTNGMENSPGNPPAFSFYRGHAAGQGTYQLGSRMPWRSADPYLLYGDKTDYSHLARADRFVQVWLEQAGYDFDVITDLDLHRHPEILNGYQAFVINGHSEYWSIPMYEGLEKYLANQGNVVCLSGNSLFWRVSFNADGTILECRKVDAPGQQLPAIRRGEAWHSHDSRRGGMMRDCGFPGWKLIGLETLGWNNQGNPDQFGPYLVERPEHFLFKKPVPLALNPGDAFGQAPGGGLPRANGHEIDVRLSTLRRLQEQPPPSGGKLPSDPPGMTLLANGVITWKIGGAAFDYFFRPIKPANDQGGEMIYWEQPAGGRVFNAGSIGSGWALHADPRFQQLLKNVLFHFGVKAKKTSNSRSGNA